MIDPRYNPFAKKKFKADGDVLMFLTLFQGDFKKKIDDELKMEY
jgi:hypothetical protein